MPLYVVYGAEDPLSRPACGQAFFDAAGSPDKTFEARKGLRHEVVNEIEWKPVVDTMAEWMSVRARRTA
jgi:alpha-beta hydrolase superfamily lysophospholipase